MSQRHAVGGLWRSSHYPFVQLDGSAYALRGAPAHLSCRAPCPRHLLLPASVQTSPAALTPSPPPKGIARQRLAPGTRVQFITPRSEQVAVVAEEYVDAWFRGVARGADAAAGTLSELVADDVQLLPDGVAHFKPIRGYEALIGLLAEQHQEYPRVHYRPIGSAVADADGVAYVLGEYRMQDVGGMSGHPATFRVSRGFCVFKLQVGPDGRIERAWVRRQLTQEDADAHVKDPVHIYPAPFPLDHMHLTARGGRPSQDAMAASARAWVAAQASPAKATGSAPPATTRTSQASLDMAQQHATLGGSDALSAAAAAATIAAAASVQRTPGRILLATFSNTSASFDEGQGPVSAAAAAAGAGSAAPQAPAEPSGALGALLRDHLAPQCRLLDAYGLWPVPALPVEEQHGGQPQHYQRHPQGGFRSHAVLGAKAVVQLLQVQQQRHHIDPHLMDVAVSEDHNLAFVHWCNFIAAPPPPPPSPAAEAAAAKHAAKARHGKEKDKGGSGKEREKDKEGIRDGQHDKDGERAQAPAPAATTASPAAAAEGAPAVSVQGAAPVTNATATAEAAPAAAAAPGAATASAPTPTPVRITINLPSDLLSNLPAGTGPRLEEMLNAAVGRVADAAHSAAAAANTAAAAATAAAVAASAAYSAATALDERRAEAAEGGRSRAATVGRQVVLETSPDGRTYYQDCMAALLFDDSGRITDVWLLRGPLHDEAHLLRM